MRITLKNGVCILLCSNDFIFICTKNIIEKWKCTTVVRHQLHTPLKKVDKLSGSDRTKGNGFACSVPYRKVNKCQVLVEDKDIFTGLFVPPYLYACLLCSGNDLPGIGERRVALCTKGTLYGFEPDAGSANGSLWVYYFTNAFFSLKNFFLKDIYCFFCFFFFWVSLSLFGDICVWVLVPMEARSIG